MSLIEVLVGLGLAGVVSTLLVSFLMTSQRVSLKELTRVSGRDQLNSCLTLFQNDLRLSSPDGVTILDGSDGHRMLVAQRNEGQSWSGQALAYDFDAKSGLLHRAQVTEKSSPILVGKFTAKSPLSLNKTELDTLFTSQFPKPSRQFEMEEWKVELVDRRTVKLLLQARVGQASIRMENVACLRL